MRHVIFIFYFLRTSGAGGALPDFLFYFPLFSRPRAGLATYYGVKHFFFGLATNTLNVRNNWGMLRRSRRVLFFKQKDV